MAEVPVGGRPTLYARWGDWVVALSLVWLAFFAGRFVMAQESHVEVVSAEGEDSAVQMG